jgi:glycosyltransferase involved in cell wall biosynthesis
VETILQAWRQLPEDITKKAWLCLFGSYGDEDMKKLVQRALAETDLHVKYMGFSDDIPAWYATMDLLVQPSWHEGWGYNVLEAACSAVPAVGTRACRKRKNIEVFFKR